MIKSYGSQNLKKVDSKDLQKALKNEIVTNGEFVNYLKKKFLKL